MQSMDASSYKPLNDVVVSDIEATGVPLPAAEKLYAELVKIVDECGNGGVETWMRISERILTPEFPFAVHQIMYYGCYRDFGDDPPVWLPDRKTAEESNVGKMLARRGLELLGGRYKDPISSFSDFQEFSVSNQEVFWKALLEEMCISFSAPPRHILVESPLHPGGQWLPGAFVNPARNCLTVNTMRDLDDVVVIWRDEGKDDLPVNKMTLEEFRKEVWLVAHALTSLGLEKGSAIAIDMPMHVTSVIIYLAIILAGFVVVSIADSFSAPEISTRLRISQAKTILVQDCIIRGTKSHPLYSKVVEAQSPKAVVIPANGIDLCMKMRDGDIAWHDFINKVERLRGLEFKASEQPIDSFSNILFSSGTTGDPKAIPWTYLTPFKAAADGWCHMDIRKGDVVAWPTNLGWMMGPWLVYASLLNGAAMALYNGAPLGSGFVKFVQDAKVTMLGVIPSIVRTWKSSNCIAGSDWSSIRCFASTGEASNVDEYLWLSGRANYRPIIECCGGTEIGGGFVCGSLLQPQSLAAFSTPAVGCSLFILGADGAPIPQDKPGIGELALGPIMFGASSMLLNADHYKVYFDGMPTWKGKVLRRHGDVFERTSKGYYRAHGRADDTMNLRGIKVGSIEIERICNSVDDRILETAAIGVPPFGGGPEQLVIATVFKNSTDKNPNPDKLKSSFNAALQAKLNPLFKVSEVVTLSSLPRTATNKVMRRVLRQRLSQLVPKPKL